MVLSAIQGFSFTDCVQQSPLVGGSADTFGILTETSSGTTLFGTSIT